MTLLVFSGHECVSCAKAKDIFAREGVAFTELPVAGPDATPQNVALMAWLGWVDKLPLIALVDGPVEKAEDAIRTWDGNDVLGREVGGKRMPFTQIAKTIKEALGG